MILPVADVERADCGLGAGSRGRRRARRQSPGEHVVEGADQYDDRQRDGQHDGDEEPRADAELAVHRIE